MISFLPNEYSRMYFTFNLCDNRNVFSEGNVNKQTDDPCTSLAQTPSGTKTFE